MRIGGAFSERGLRPVLWSVATVAAILTLGMTLAATSRAASSNLPSAGRVFASPFNPATPSAPQDPPSNKALAALTDRGISQPRARESLELQGKVAETQLAGHVERALGGDFAGVWFTPEAAKFHVGATSVADEQVIRLLAAQAGLADEVIVTPVRSTWAQLLAAQQRWRKRLAKLIAHEEAMTAIDSQGNSLSVTLSPSVPSQERAALEREATTASANVPVEITSSPWFVGRKPEAKPVCEKIFASGSAFCEKTLTSGIGWSCRRKAGKECDTTEIEPVGAQCTAGPMLIKGTETYMLTAGHCFGEKSPEGEPLKPQEIKVKVSSATPKEPAVQKEIGNEGSWLQNKERDIAEVKIKTAGEVWTEALPTPVPAYIAEWGQLPERPHEVTGPEASIEGQENCHEGMVSGEQCGIVGNTNVENLVEDTGCSEGGDSGGPWFRRDIISGEEFAVWMQGTHVSKETVVGEVAIKCNAIPEFEQEAQTNENTELTGLKAVGAIKVGWEVIGNGIVKNTQVTKINEIKPEDFTLIISKAATTKEKVKLKFRPYFRAYYEPINTIFATFKGQKLLTAANETRKPRIRGPKGGVLTKKAYTSTSGASTIETKAGSKLTCTADTGKGEASALSTGTAKITLTGCEGFGGKCHTAGAAEGEVVLSANYTLAFTNGAKAEVGLLLELTEATIECGKNCEGKALEKLKVRGTGIGPITPIDEEVVPAKKFKVAFSQSKGVQSPTEYENEKGAKVKAIIEMEGSGTKVFAFEQAGISDTDELLFEETAEIES
jgi:hypothetical protein